MEVNREKYSFEEIEAEQKQIEDCFLTLRFGQKIRKESLACFKKCGGNVKYPFRIEADYLVGK